MSNLARVPTTEQVRYAYAVVPAAPHTGEGSLRAAGFNTWLAAVKAAAWDEGYTRGFYDSQPLPNTADASEGSSENPHEVSS